MTEKETPLLSVVIASHLGYYPNCASYRPEKFIRAIDSCVNQRFRNFEVIIVADGCEKTIELFDKYYKGMDFITCLSLPKQKLWSGKVRNNGIEAAKGEFITYLDTDDKIGVNHLQIIADNLSGYDWVWYDDYLISLKYKANQNHCELKFGKCGTSNLTHKKSLPVRWNDSTYRHDWIFIQELMKHKNHAKIAMPEYFICHQPRPAGVDV